MSSTTTGFLVEAMPVVTSTQAAATSGSMGNADMKMPDKLRSAKADGDAAMIDPLVPDAEEIVRWKDLPADEQDGTALLAAVEKKSQSKSAQKEFSRPSRFPAFPITESDIEAANDAASAQMLAADAPAWMARHHSRGECQSLFWIDFAHDQEVITFNTNTIAVKPSAQQPQQDVKQVKISTWIDTLQNGRDYLSPCPTPLFVLKDLKKGCVKLPFESARDLRRSDLVSGQSSAGYSIETLRKICADCLPDRSDYHAVVLGAYVEEFKLSENIPGSVEAGLSTTVFQSNGSGRTATDMVSRDIVRMNSDYCGVEIVPVKDGKAEAEQATTASDAQKKKAKKGAKESDSQTNYLFKPIEDVRKRRMKSAASTPDGVGRVSERILVQPGKFVDDTICHDPELTLAHFSEEFLKDPWISRTMFLDFRQLEIDIDRATVKEDAQGKLVRLDCPDTNACRFDNFLTFLVFSQWSWLVGKTREYTQDNQERLTKALSWTLVAPIIKKPSTESSSSMASQKPESQYEIYVYKPALEDLIGRLKRRTWKVNALQNLTRLKLQVAIPTEDRKAANNIRSACYADERDPTECDPFVRWWMRVKIVYAALPDKTVVPEMQRPTTQIDVDWSLDRISDQQKTPRDQMRAAIAAGDAKQSELNPEFWRERAFESTAMADKLLRSKQAQAVDDDPMDTGHKGKYSKTSVKEKVAKPGLARASSKT